MRRFILPVLMTLATATYAQKTAPATSTATSAAETTTQAQVAPAFPTDIADSTETRERFRELLRRTPPHVGVLLKLDPTLFSNKEFLATYPAVGSFIAQHPEVPHNPGYYLSSVWVPGDPDQRPANYRMWEDTMTGLFVLTIISVIVGVLTWLIRTLVEQRRWSRLARVQAEVHGKLLERFSNNEDLLRYIDTPAGRRFLESAPIPVESGPRQVSAPIGRILWSIQTGLVVAAAGLGLQWVSSGVDKDAAQPLYALGVVALCVGIAFVLSAVISFILSRRLKLFEVPESPSTV